VSATGVRPAPSRSPAELGPGPLGRGPARAGAGWGGDRCTPPRWPARAGQRGRQHPAGLVDPALIGPARRRSAGTACAGSFDRHPRSSPAPSAGRRRRLPAGRTAGSAIWLRGTPVLTGPLLEQGRTESPVQPTGSGSSSLGLLPARWPGATHDRPGWAGPAPDCPTAAMVAAVGHRAAAAGVTLPGFVRTGHPWSRAPVHHATAWVGQVQAAGRWTGCAPRRKMADPGEHGQCPRKPPGSPGTRNGNPPMWSGAQSKTPNVNATPRAR